MEKEDEKVIELLGKVIEQLGQQLQRGAAKVDEQQTKINEALDQLKNNLMAIAQVMIDARDEKFDVKEIEDLNYRPPEAE